MTVCGEKGTRYGKEEFHFCPGMNIISTSTIFSTIFALQNTYGISIWYNTQPSQLHVTT